MTVTKEEAQMILAALDKIPVQGVQIQKQVVVLCAKLEAFLAKEETSGDDVSEPTE
jgi:hypothetical protein